MPDNVTLDSAAIAPNVDTGAKLQFSSAPPGVWLELTVGSTIDLPAGFEYLASDPRFTVNPPPP